MTSAHPPAAGRIFVSYSTRDKAAAEEVCRFLEGAEFPCWMAPRDISPGEEWGAAIVRAVGDTHLMVLLWSAAANDSPQIRREVERAASRGIPIICFRLENVLPSGSLEYYLSTVHWLDAFRVSRPEALEQLLQAIRNPPARSVPPPGALRPRRRRKVIAAGAAAVLLAVLGISLFAPPFGTPP
ncbi:MAG: toll/interleukin-1 receptor domain-containing protein, partial [Bacteroidota bacterium]